MKRFVISLPEALPIARIINICLDKTKANLGGYKNYAELAWNRLIQRYYKYLKTDVNDIGIIITDDTDEPLIRFCS